MGKYKSIWTGPQIDEGVGAARNPDTVPTSGSDALITSDAVEKVQQGFAPIESDATASQAYAIGDLLVWGGSLYKAKTAIAVNDSFTVGTNIEATTIADKLNNIDTEITPDTDTTINGLLKGNGSKVAQAVGDTDYATPAAVTATRQMLAPILADPAGQAVSAGDFFIYNGVLRKALQAITSAMTAATFTGATYSEAVSNGGLNELKSALTVVENKIIAPETGNAGYHNSIYRGKYLGTSVTAAQYAAIDAGTFDDLFIGDYWTIDGVDWRIAHFDYWYNKGNTACTTHHVVIVPDSLLATGVKMNNSNVTTGGYVGSAMYTTNLATAKSTIQTAFGSGHILTKREYLVNAVTNGKPSGGEWKDSAVDLMNEPMVYGSYIFTPANDGSTIPTLYTVSNTQLALFAHAPEFICNRADWWLRDVVSSATFARVDGNGACADANASNSRGVRPAFAIK